jgi:[ribosomal protein S5]-alanine N-acetyltransferase
MIRTPPTFPTLKTKRLWLRPLALKDADKIQKLFPQWEIVKHLARQVPWPYPPNGALLFCRNIALPAMARGEQWHWTLRLQSRPGQLIGAISLFRDGDNNRGFWLAKEWQCQGLMTEAVEAVTAFWFEELGMATLCAPKAAANIASRRISEKTGMRLVETKESDYVSGRLPTEVWEITAEEWRERQKHQPR